ncbi:oxidoreductase [Hydrogenophaga sp. OTU3427]|uniref:oxidoreductase n=1 Tax=Hydrogenophaga sp. OTU3427 TaxID=3043856 RepID=UPI00313B0555
MRSCVETRKYFFLAVNTGFAVGGEPDSRCRDFYRSRSGNGLHCAIVGNVVTPLGIGSNDVCAEISDSGSWQELAETISEQGALAGVQLSSAWRNYIGMKQFVPRAGRDPLSEYKTLGASISATAARAAFDELFRGTELAIKAGFRHIQLHAAHGYLFNVLVDRRLSSHADFAFRSICRWVDELASSHIETSVRFSMWAGHPVLDQDRASQFADEIAALPVNYIDVSAGFYNVNKRLIYPSTPAILSKREKATLDIAARHPLKSFVMSGRSTGAWDDSVPSNVHIGICRDLIANPNYLADRTGGCNTCMKCHYYSRGESHITCGKWLPDD